MYSPNSRGCWERREKRVVTSGGGEREREEGRMVLVLEEHLGEVYEGKFLFVVMVTGSVVCSKNISLA